MAKNGWIREYRKDNKGIMKWMDVLYENGKIKNKHIVKQFNTSNPERKKEGQYYNGNQILADLSESDFKIMKNILNLKGSQSDYKHDIMFTDNEISTETLINSILFNTEKYKNTYSDFYLSNGDVWIIESKELPKKKEQSVVLEKPIIPPVTLEKPKIPDYLEKSTYSIKYETFTSDGTYAGEGYVEVKADTVSQARSIAHGKLKEQFGDFPTTSGYPRGSYRLV